MGLSKNVIAYAKSQIGYQEGYSNGHWNNHEKYGAMIGMPEASANQWAWCCIFDFACLKQGGCGSGGLTVTAGVAELMNEGKRKGRFSEYPAVGVLGIINGGEHTFIVTAWDATYIYTVEGNSNNNGSAEGDGVYAHKRVRSAANITGYVYPFYDEYANSADPAWQGKWMGAGKAPVPVASHPAAPAAPKPAAPVVVKPAPVVTKPVTPVVTKPSTPAAPVQVPVIVKAAPLGSALPDPATPDVSSGPQSSLGHVAGDNGVFVPVTLGYLHQDTNSNTTGGN